MPTGKNLTEAWREAAAAEPSDWTIHGVVRGPRVADPAIEDERWVAWARGPGDDPPVEGSGDSPEDALLSLANALKSLA